jgi:hypothetical protein
MPSLAMRPLSTRHRAPSERGKPCISEQRLVKTDKRPCCRCQGMGECDYRRELLTNYRHCCACAEHDATLVAHDVDSIGVPQLGNPGWDPLCFASVDGLLYYMPALIRLTLETMEKPQKRYLDQLLFHLIYDGQDNRIVRACHPEQRAFIADFLAHLMEQYSAEIDECLYADDMLKADDIWRNS